MNFLWKDFFSIRWCEKPVWKPPFAISNDVKKNSKRDQRVTVGF